MQEKRNEMAKKSILAREVKRRKLEEQFSESRGELRKRVHDQTLAEEERWLAMMTLQKLPREPILISLPFRFVSLAFKSVTEIGIRATTPRPPHPYVRKW
jgi:hypothetical protein